MDNNKNNDLLNYLASSPFYAGIGVESATSRTAFINAFYSLDTTAKEFLTSEKTANQIFSLGAQFNLKQNQITIVALLIRNIVTKNIATKDLVGSLSHILGIDANTSKLLSSKIVSEILLPAKLPLDLNHSTSPVPPTPPSLHDQNTQGNVIDLRNK